MFKTKVRRHVGGHGRRAKTFGGVVATGQKSHAGFTCKMGLRFRHFARNKGIGPGCDGGFKVALGPTGAPSDAAQWPPVTRQHQGHPAQAGLKALSQHRQAVQSRGTAYKTQTLFAKPGIGLQAQAPTQLRVVAQFGVGIQRQVVGKQVHTMLHQTAHALAQPASQSAVLTAPEQAVVHEQSIGTVGDGGVDEGQAGRDARDQAAQRPVAFDLQTIRPIILEALRLQQNLQKSVYFFQLGHGAAAPFLQDMLRRTWLVFSQAVTVALAVLFVLLTLKPEWLPRSSERGALPLPTILQAVPGSVGAGGGGFSAAARLAAPTVVSIVASKASRHNPHADDPRFRFFFGEQGEDPGTQTGLGSGVIVSPEGYLLTNNHAIEGADDIEVQLTDGRQVRARLVGADAETDLAVLKIELESLPVIAFGNAPTLQVGDAVLAIGNPFNVGQTVTAGIVSALGRNQLGLSTFENFIQTDAAINPGNSGGALVDAAGHLVGINTAIFSRSGGSLGIGFAIPVDTARQVMEALVKDGQVTRGWIGVEPRNLTAEMADSLQLKVSGGVLITGVLQDGPASRGGLKPGDVVVKITDRPVANTSELLAAVAALKPQSTAVVTVQRGAQALALTVTVAQRPPAKRRPNR